MRLFFVVIVLSIGFIPAFAQSSNNLTSTIKELDELLSKQIQMLNEIKSSSSCQENECANITSQLIQMNSNLFKINNSIELSGIPNLLFSAISIFIAGIAVITAFVTAYYSRKQFQQTNAQLKQTTKIEEQKFLLELDNRLMKKENVKISHKINDEVYDRKPFLIEDDETKNNVTNYLNDLETICNLYEQQIITIKQLDTFDGMQIIEAMKSESIRRFIKLKREEKKTPHLWSGIENAAKELENKSKLD